VVLEQRRRRESFLFFAAEGRIFDTRSSRSANSRELSRIADQLDGLCHTIALGAPPRALEVTRAALVLVQLHPAGASPTACFLHAPEPPPRMPSMTVCIAAICENGDAIVLAADRVRWPGDAPMQIELDIPKYHFLTDSLAIMQSGTTQVAASALRRFRTFPPAPGSTTAVAVDHLIEACQYVRNKQVEASYTSRVGMTIDDVKAVATVASPGSIIADIYSKIVSYRFGTVFIVAGIDNNGAHLHNVDDLNESDCDEIGYATIGMGDSFASISLARRMHRKSASISEALYGAYEAKRSAELAKGVGRATDMSIMKRGQKPVAVSEATMRALAAVYARHAVKLLTTADTDTIAATLNLPDAVPRRITRRNSKRDRPA